MFNLGSERTAYGKASKIEKIVQRVQKAAPLLSSSYFHLSIFTLLLSFYDFSLSYFVVNQRGDCPIAIPHAERQRQKGEAAAEERDDAEGETSNE